MRVSPPAPRRQHPCADVLQSRRLPAAGAAPRPSPCPRGRSGTCAHSGATASPRPGDARRAGRPLNRGRHIGDATITPDHNLLEGTSVAHVEQKNNGQQQEGPQGYPREPSYRTSIERPHHHFSRSTNRLPLSCFDNLWLISGHHLRGSRFATLLLRHHLHRISQRAGRDMRIARRNLRVAVTGYGRYGPKLNSTRGHVGTSRVSQVVNS